MRTSKAKIIEPPFDEIFKEFQRRDNSKHFAPFKIDIIDFSKPIKFDQFIIRPLTEKEKYKYWGIKRAVIDEHGNPGDIVLFNKGSITKHEKFPRKLFGATFLIEFNNSNSYFDNITPLLTAFRLYKTGDIFAPYCFSKDGSQTLTTYPEFTNYKSIFRINVADIEAIEKLYKIVKTSLTEKSKLLLERFNNAIASTTSKINTYIEFVSMIESIMVGEPYELRFRFALFSTFILITFCSFPIKYKELLDIYDLRSKLIHTGKSEKFSDIKLERLADITIRIIRWYLETGEKDDHGRKLMFERINII
jgi:hypothetical protein